MRSDRFRFSLPERSVATPLAGDLRASERVFIPVQFESNLQQALTLRL
jgi:hypothetical protein